MANIFSSAIFCGRNIDKTANGEFGRSAVATGQGVNVIREIGKLDNAAGDAIRSTTSIFSDMAKGSKILNYTGKALDFASKNVNPLICVSSGLKVISSDNKAETALTEIGALSGMFLGEGLWKRVQHSLINEKTVGSAIEKLSANPNAKKYLGKILNSKFAGKYAELLKGLIFVTVSISSYAIGQNLGKNVAGQVCANSMMSKKIDQKA